MNSHIDHEAIVKHQRSTDYWVVKPVTLPTVIKRIDDMIIMNNGLVERQLSLSTNLLTTAYRNLYKLSVQILPSV